MTHIAIYTRRDGTRGIDVWAEEVNGTVVGTFTWPYEFWAGGRRIAKGLFENDERAVAWFRKNYPEQFKIGVEMRVFEQG